MYNREDIEVEFVPFYWVCKGFVLSSLRGDFETDITGNRAMGHLNYGHGTKESAYVILLTQMNLMSLVLD